jgi:protein gp37
MNQGCNPIPRLCTLVDPKSAPQAIIGFSGNLKFSTLGTWRNSMSIKTKIQWCDSTVNPTMGCDGCELWDLPRRSCYAGTLHTRFGGVTPGYAPTFEEVTLFPGRTAEASRWADLTGTTRTDKPWLNGLPRLIFVSDMSDSLSASVSFEYLVEEVVNLVSEGPGRRHHWLWLTKRARRMASFSSWLAERGIEWPDNLWAGTSITTRRSTVRINNLLRVGTPRTIRFLSVEPQVEPIDLRHWLAGLNWVIQGGESGRRARPFDLEWARELIGQCEEHKVPYFLKQLGSHVVEASKRLDFSDGHASDWLKWPDAIKIRKMPLRPDRNAQSG